LDAAGGPGGSGPGQDVDPRGGASRSRAIPAATAPRSEGSRR